MKNDLPSLLFFPNETFDLVCFFAFQWDRIAFWCIIGQGVAGYASPGKFELSECQKCWFLAFWQAVCIITNAVTAKFEGFFGAPPLL